MRYAETGVNLEIDLSRGSIEREGTAPNLTEATYYGHGKLAVRVGEGKGDSDFDCLMILEPRPVPDELEPGTKVAALSTPDAEHVQTAAV